MFLTKEQIKNKVAEIVYDNVDNDIVFIVAHRGIGKTKILQELYTLISSNNQLIVADGNAIYKSVSKLKKCYIDGIVQYICKYNTKKTRTKICDLLFSEVSIFQKRRMIKKKKVDISSVISVLCSFSLDKLKETYYDFAEDTPLVIISASMSLTEEESHCLMALQNDKFGEIGARVTFFIGIRSTQKNLTLIDNVIKAKTSGIWILPLMPKIEKQGVDRDPYSFSSIIVQNIGSINNSLQLQHKLLLSDIYNETFEAARHFCDAHFNPFCLFILANQEIKYELYQYTCNLVKSLFKEVLPEYDNSFVLPNNGKYLWVDVLSYYIVLSLGIQDALNKTQDFFLGLIKKISTSSICLDKSLRNGFLQYIKQLSKLNENTLANGFAEYYSDFAELTKLLFYIYINREQSYQKQVESAGVLERVLINYSDNNINAIKAIYENTHICFILDIGLKSIISFIRAMSRDSIIPDATLETIEQFVAFCVHEAIKWNDLTIVEEIAELDILIRIQGKVICYCATDLAINGESIGLDNYYFEITTKLIREMGDLTMKKETIFLSYTHNDGKYADGIESALQELGYEVKRDIHNISNWDDLNGFMKTIRKEDFVVFLVSDNYLHKDKCLYEIMQFLKDESNEIRAFPIVIGFSKEEKNKRSEEGKEISMFKTEYTIEIVSYWQERAKEMSALLSKLQPENRAELDAEYRDISKMAQTASEFLSKFFGKKLMTIEPKKPKYKLIALEIDNKIRRIQSYKFRRHNL